MSVFSLRGHRGVSRRVGDLFTLSAWGSRQPWRPAAPRSATPGADEGTSSSGAGRGPTRRRRKAA